MKYMYKEPNDLQQQKRGRSDNNDKISETDLKTMVSTPLNECTNAQSQTD